MNETEFSNAHELYDAYAPGENRHGPNMEVAAGSMATPTGTNMSGVKTSSLIDTYYIYAFDGKLMAEYDHDGICVKEYIYLGGQLIAEYQPQTAKYYYYARDQINSTRVVLDDNADLVHSSAYGPYGQVLDTTTNTYEPKLKFSGKEREGYSNLDYFGARYYDNQSFRFNSVDPIITKEEALINPQLWNLYSYCRDNPITYLDPDGRVSVGYPTVMAAVKDIEISFYRAFVAVWKASGGHTSAQTGNERGAWIYTDGTHELWPPTPLKVKTNPSKEPSKPLAASVHNHPDGKSKPEPSDTDMKFVTFYHTENSGQKKYVHRGKRLFTVSKSGVWVFDPTVASGEGRVRQVLSKKEFKTIRKMFE